jgi:hypothetical protein
MAGIRHSYVIGATHLGLHSQRKNPNNRANIYHENMKLKIKIAGTRVHEVGYRVFLLKHAMNLALPGLSTYNWEEGSQ